MNRLSIRVVLLALGMATAEAQASTNTYYPGNATINTAIAHDAVIGYANDADYKGGVNPVNPTSPSVNLVTGGSIDGFTYVYNSSTFNMSGGSASSGIGAYNNSTVVMSGGFTDDVTGNGSANITISGGQVEFDVNLFDNSSATLGNGQFDIVQINVNNHLTVTGGTYSGYIDVDGGTAVISPATADDAIVENHGSMTVNGGIFDGISADTGATLTINGGEFDSLASIEPNSTGVINGGNFTEGFDGLGTVTIRGGMFAGFNSSLIDGSTTSFTLVGTGLSAIDVGPHFNGGEDYLLTGVLADGSSVTGDIVDVEPGAVMFTLQNAPEPASLGVFGVGMLVAGLRRRVKR